MGDICDDWGTNVIGWGSYSCINVLVTSIHHVSDVVPPLGASLDVSEGVGVVIADVLHSDIGNAATGLRADGNTRHITIAGEVADSDVNGGRVVVDAEAVPPFDGYSLAVTFEYLTRQPHTRSPPLHFTHLLMLIPYTPLLTLDQVFHG